MLALFEQAQTFNEAIARLTPEMYQKLKTAVEIGKWPHGEPLDQTQKSLCLQAVIAYEQQPMSAQERTGFVPPKNQACGDKQAQPSNGHTNSPPNGNDEQILTLK